MCRYLPVRESDSAVSRRHMGNRTDTGFSRCQRGRGICGGGFRWVLFCSGGEQISIELCNQDPTSADTAATAQQVARQTNGVKEVRDELRMGPTGPQ